MIEIPDGNYPATVVDHYIAQSKEKKTLSVQFILAVETDSGTHEMYADLWLTQSAVQRTVDTLDKVFEWKGNDFRELHGTGTLKDKKCSVKLENESYDGKITPKIKFINSARRQAGPLTEEMADAIREMNRMIGTAPAPATPFEQFKAQQKKEDDLPF